MNLHDADELLTPAEVAAMLFVDPKTVTRWARAGKLDAIRTPGGHRRYRRTDVLAIMTGDYQTAVPVALSSRSIPVSREPVDAGEVVAAVLVAEEAATALEAEADLAAQAMRETAVAVAAAAERAATAASRARAARAFAASLAAQSRLQAAEVAATARKGTAEIQVPSQRDRVDQEIVSA